jgi:ABC-type nitrate/sulfonate/bicarbonate transport system substrate-binding protein
MVSQTAWDAGVRSVADLKGKRIGIPGPGGFGMFSVGKALEKGGLTFDDVEPVFLPPPATAAAFANGALDAGWSIEPFAGQLEKQGLGRRLVEDHTFGTELGLIAFNQDFVAANEDAVVKFMAAYLKAARLLDNGGWEDAKILDVVAKYTGTEPDALRGIPYTVRSEDGAIDMASVREQEEFFRKRGALEYDGPVDIESVYRVDLLKRANDLLASKP